MSDRLEPQDMLVGISFAAFWSVPWGLGAAAADEAGWWLPVRVVLYVIAVVPAVGLHVLYFLQWQSERKTARAVSKDAL